MFLISKIILLQKNFECIKHALKAGYKGKSEMTKAKESKKSKTEGDMVSPQTRAQSNKEQMNSSNHKLNLWLGSPKGLHVKEFQDHIPLKELQNHKLNIYFLPSNNRYLSQISLLQSEITIFNLRLLCYSACFQL